MKFLSEEQIRTFWYRTCIGLIVVSTLFSFVVAAALSVNQIRLKDADPLNADSLFALQERLKTEPRDQALKEEIRQLDLLARRAWFGSVRFQETGIYLLLAGGLVLVISLKSVTALRSGKKGSSLRKQEVKGVLGHAWWVGAAVFTGAAAGALFLAPGSWFQAPQGSLPQHSGVDISAGTKEGGEPAQIAGPGREWAKQWPSFRGPDGLARAADGPWPTSWDGSSGDGILWKTRIPLAGRGSPVVWKDRVFLSGGSDEVLQVYCFDAAAGDLLWSYRVQEVAPGLRPPVTDDTGHAAPTMATDGKKVYAVFSTGDMVALDFDGRLAWQQDLGPPDNPYGHASSLITYGELVIVLYDHWASSSIMAFDGASGEMAWETFRDMDISWTSPIVIRPAGGDQLVVSGNPYVAGYDPLTGDELWRLQAMSGEVASSPAWMGSMVFAANEYATLAAISIEKEPRIVWEYEEDLPEVSSVLAAGARLYMANGAGTVTCLDQASGTVLWRVEMDEGFYSSPVLAGGNVYLLDRSGTMKIFADADSYTPVSSCTLGEAANCTAAFAAQRIYLRGDEYLYSIGEPEP